MKKINVKKGEILQQKGDLNSKTYTVEKGLLRSYSIDEKGKEHIFMFAPENWLVADNSPTEEPAELFIDALEDSTVHVGEKVFNEDNFSDKIMKRLSVLQKRIIMLMSSSAIDRYEYFEKTYPQIVQRVSQKMIASFLGITPEALSRVKKERNSKK